jgi:hypothetical protein
MHLNRLARLPRLVADKLKPLNPLQEIGENDPRFQTCERRARSWPGVRTVPQLDSAELLGKRAGDREIVRCDLVGDRHEIAIANERLGR